MVYFKSVAEVRRNSQDRKEKMKPEHFNEVESKV